MDQRVGEEFDALVISTTKYGLFVELENLFIEGRSEERRVGKECRSRGAPDHLKKKATKPWLRDVTFVKTGRSGASLGAIRAVRKEAENPVYAASSSLNLRCPPHITAHHTCPPPAY